jgi:hypothetical protein
MASSAGVAHSAELAGVSIVGAGAFNPAIFHPLWFSQNGLLTETAVEDALAKEFVAVRELSNFTADWLSVQVTLQQAVFASVEEGREFDLRDVARCVFALLPETPVDAVGLNADAHFRVASEEAWHALGDRFLPKDFWQPVFEGDEWRKRPDGQSVGLRSMTVEAWREDITAWVRTEVAPSTRLSPNGVYIGVNAHFQLTEGEHRGDGAQAAKTIEERWDITRELERVLTKSILDLA